MLWKLPIFFSFLCAFINLEAREIEFTWQAFPEAREYQLQVAKTRAFKEIKHDERTELPQVKVELPMGIYYYRVRAIDQKNRPGIWSQALIINVTPFPPKLVSPAKGAKFNFFEKKNDIEFSWENQEGDVEYDILIQKTNGKVVLEKRVQENSVVINSLDAGDYMWKVRSRFQKKLITQYSENSFLFITKTPIKDPQLISPKDGDEFPAFREHEFVWKKDEVAQFTDIEIRRIDDKKDRIRPLLNQSGESTDLPALLPGEYRWRIRTKEAKDSKGKISSWAKFKTSSSVLTGNNHMFRFRTGIATNRYNYDSSRTGGYTGGGDDTNTFVNLFTRLHITRGIALSFDVAETEFEINSNNLSFNKSSMLLEFRFAENDFQQSSIIGYRLEDNYDFINTNEAQKLSTQGLVLGIAMDGYLGTKSKFRLGLSYFKPKSLFQKGAELTADVYEARLSYSYNVLERFWLEYEFAYDKYIFKLDEDGAGLISRWTYDISQPINIAISYEY